ncbi:MAG: Asp-tRNA(Asn)/Glu-tRNA(Gln) amidotransferase subunit GatC [Pseudomonadota bacterium]
MNEGKEKIGRREIEGIAKLARLRIHEQDIGKMAEQLNSVLNYMDKLGELDAGNIEPLAHPLNLPTPYRDDEAKPGLAPEKSLENAPSREGDFFKAPKVF